MSGAPRPWSGRLFLGTGTFLFVGPGGHADTHAHHAVQLLWAGSGRMVVTLGGKRRRPRAALIPPNTPHGCDAGDANVVLMLVEPHGARGAALARRARAADGADQAAALAGVGFPSTAMSAAAAARWCDAAATALGAPAGHEPLSVISRRAIAYVERTVERTPRLADAAAHARVSPTRMTHVFTREVGIPFRRFVLWTKLKRAVAATAAGADLTGAAQHGGFADSAHLSRTFLATFGLSPSLLLPHVELLADAAGLG